VGEGRARGEVGCVRGGGGGNPSLNRGAGGVIEGVICNTAFFNCRSKLLESS
jgi:hypothetical protein